MPKPWRAAARAKASSEISPRRLVVSSRSKGVWGWAAAAVGRAWAGRSLRPREGPLRLRMNSGLDLRSGSSGFIKSGLEMCSEKQKAQAEGPAPVFTLYNHYIIFAGSTVTRAAVYLLNGNNQLRGKAQV